MIYKILVTYIQLKIKIQDYKAFTYQNIKHTDEYIEKTKNK